MTPLPVQDGRIFRKEYRLFLEIRRIFEELPHFNFPVSSHILCRALVEQFPHTHCADGYFGESYHSWLVLRECNQRPHHEPDRIIIDAYPVGGVAPALLLCEWGTHPYQSYREHRWVPQKIAVTSNLAEHVTNVSQAIARIRAQQ